MDDKFNIYKEGLANIGISTINSDGSAKDGYDIFSELANKWNEPRELVVNIDVDISPNLSSDYILENLHNSLLNNHEHRWTPIANSSDVSCKICGIRAKRSVMYFDKNKGANE